jgi:hypothetical protein
MSPLAAIALRRAAIATGALGATVVGHMLTSGGWGLLPIAPFLWMGILALVTLSTAHRGATAAFRRWSPVKILAVLVAGQGMFHVAADSAPWALGLTMTGHHHPPLVSARVVVVHVALAAAIWVALCFGQRLLATAVAVVRSLLAPEPRPGHAGPAARLRAPALVIGGRRARRPRSSRGPPRAARPLRHGQSRPVLT